MHLFSYRTHDVMTGALSLEFSRSTYIYMRVTWLNTVCISYQSSKVNSTPGYTRTRSCKTMLGGKKWPSCAWKWQNHSKLKRSYSHVGYCTFFRYSLLPLLCFSTFVLNPTHTLRHCYHLHIQYNGQKIINNRLLTETSQIMTVPSRDPVASLDPLWENLRNQTWEGKQ